MGKGDTETTASRVVGNAFYVPPTEPAESLSEEGLVVVAGEQCELPYSVKVSVTEGTEEREVSAAVGDAVKEVLGLAEERFSGYREDSEVNRLNRAGPDTAHEASPEMLEVLAVANLVWRSSRGLFDVAAVPPRGSEGYRGSWLDVKVENGRVRMPAGTQLDLGGVAKGWAIDRLADRIAGLPGVAGALVTWAGDVACRGLRGPGVPWAVRVSAPPGASGVGDPAALAVLTLHPGDAVATSGDYAQQRAGSGPEGHHIFLPKEGAWAQRREAAVAQATVHVRGACAYADALATAALVAGVAGVKAARMMVEVAGDQLPPMLEDYVLYAREGPRVCRYLRPGGEDPVGRRTRFANCKAATVVVVGGGLAGLSAAVTAAEAGARVIILESEPKLGGNSAKATSGINGWGTQAQRAHNVRDECRFFERDTFRSAVGSHDLDPALIQVLATKAPHAIDWLRSDVGVPLEVISQLGGHSAPRTHRAPISKDGKPVPIGWLIMEYMKTTVQTRHAEAITVITGARVTNLITENKPVANDYKETIRMYVSGVVYEQDGSAHELRGDAVILACGGFGADSGPGGLLQQHCPQVATMPTTNGAFARGDGMRFVSAIGGNLVDMDKVQLHPTGFVDPNDPLNQTKFLGPEALRGSGGVLLNEEGKRFVNELDLRSVVSQAILTRCGTLDVGDGKVGPHVSWCLMNKDAQEKFGTAQLSFYADRMKLFQRARNVAEAAKLIGCDEAVLRQTLDEYEKACGLGHCPLTHKTAYPTVIRADDEDLLLARVTPVIHYCMGGVQISASCEVQQMIQTTLFGKRRHIGGLFAAGEVTGGLHGGNRLGGNSLLDCAVFGQIAGDRAATILQESNRCLGTDEWTPVVLREVRNTDDRYGFNTREFRFNLHGALQLSGLEVGQFIAIRGEVDGDTVQGYYSPITRPDDEGVIGILCRVDEKGGPIVDFLNRIRPGNTAYMKAMGGLKLRFGRNGISWEDRPVRRISMLAGGTGIAPMVQITRAYLRYHLACNVEEKQALRLLYAAEESIDLAFVRTLDNIATTCPDVFAYGKILNKPPLGWTEGVGFVTPALIKEHLHFPPAEDTLIVICGPPIFEKIMCGTLAKMGYPRHTFYSFSQN